MADFRKYFYALAAVMLLTAIAVPASAQGMSCAQPIGVNAAIRQGGYKEMAGDFVISCASEIPGVSTPAGIAVKQGTLRLTVLNTTFTTKTVVPGTPALMEALLLVDNPSPTGPNGLYQGQFACGQGSPQTDNSVNGPAVCSILSTGNPDQTYDGTPGNGYGNGRPNIFQARYVNATTVEFVGVPLDPPGTNKLRVFRFVNNRVNASGLGLGTTVQFQLSVVNSQTSFALPLTTTANVGTVVPSAPTTVITSNSYTVCTGAFRRPAGAIQITEGTDATTASTWRARNTNAHVQNATNYAFNQFIYNVGSTVFPVADVAQNYPLGGFFTESGFEFDPGTPMNNNLNAAGSSTSGTRLTFPISAVPTGTTVTFPPTVNLTNGVSGPVTGFLVLLGPPYTTATQVTYEVGFANPFVNEVATIVPQISYLPSQPPAPQSMSAGNAILAPFSGSNDTITFPLFAGSLGSANSTIVTIGSCQCSLLFPWVVNNSQYVTGIAVSNTSMDPTNAGLGNNTFAGPSLQAGVVKLYLFGTNSAGNTAVSSLSQTSASVPAGQSTAFLVSGISGGFQGYAITQSDFQYCHGAAFVFAGGGQNATMSYLGLVMDHSLFPLQRTNSFQADSLDH